MRHPTRTYIMHTMRARMDGRCHMRAATVGCRASTRWDLNPSNSTLTPSNPPDPDPNQSFFDKMDTNGDGSVTKEEAIAFWGSNFAKVSAAPPRRSVPGRRRRRRGCLPGRCDACLALSHMHTTAPSRPRSMPRPCSTRSTRMETTASRELAGWQRGLEAGQPQQPRPAAPRASGLATLLPRPGPATTTHVWCRPLLALYADA